MGVFQVGASTKWKSRYHFVWGTKYRHQIITQPVANHVKETVMGVCHRYDYTYDSLGTDGDHVHLLVGAGPTLTPESIMRTVKSITARSIFERFPSIKKVLWGGSIWATGYYWATVGDGGSEEVIRTYVINQGTEEEKALIKQLKLL
ncbi:MAG TPA: IS200/IS605 family transposase [Ginsengibacter sp.]|nr:IS200/IS605 family transposase [Ginsengibacter sp.]